MGVKVSVDGWDVGETGLQGSKMQGSSGSMEIGIFFVCFVYLCVLCMGDHWNEEWE